MENCCSHAEIERLFGQVVGLCGTYHRADPLDLRKKKVRHEHEPPCRRVWIVLQDQTYVLIEPSWANGDRPEEEILRLEGKQVAVVGIILPNSPEDPDGEEHPVQTLMVPTIRRVESISEIIKH